MKIVNKKLKNVEIRQLFEEFNRLAFQDGLNAKYSYMVFKNSEILLPKFQEIMNRLYDEQKDPEFHQWLDKQNEIRTRFADRDEQGNVKTDPNGNLIIIDQIVECDKELEKLNIDFKELNERLKAKDGYNRQIYMEEIDIDIVTLDIDEFPNTAKPFVVALCITE